MPYKVTLQIETGNSAFDDSELCPEIARVLHEAGTRMDHYIQQREQCGKAGGKFHLYESNGNKCGTVTIRKTRS